MSKFSFDIETFSRGTEYSYVFQPDISILTSDPTISLVSFRVRVYVYIYIYIYLCTLVFIPAYLGQPICECHTCLMFKQIILKDKNTLRLYFLPRKPPFYRQRWSKPWIFVALVFARRTSLRFAVCLHDVTTRKQNFVYCHENQRVVDVATASGDSDDEYEHESIRRSCQFSH